MPRYVHFEHFVQDPQKAIDFYGKVFGWQFQQHGDYPYWLAITGAEGEPGINGGIGVAPTPNAQSVVNTINVDDIGDAIKRAQEAGATLAMEKQPIPGIGWVAYLIDPTGVQFGVFQNDPSAA